ncbi:transporter substrate-binding domain-containing protein [Martelella endophytica]|uniref:transporter substrate-binding domain-containing protein n=1 Tax=Martelella endophytica TaxID=1486262 RepID=UPI000AD90457|nr:transporter substrate-binding domain-containing protein [Martelella endophytica]
MQQYRKALENKGESCFQMRGGARPSMLWRHCLACVFLFAFLAVSFFASLSPARAGDLDLSDAERAWIAAHPVASVGVVADNDPYSFYRNGNILGWTVDVIDRIGTMTGLDFRPRMGSWSEIYRQFQDGGLDAIADISLTPGRSQFITFTEPYHLRRTVLYENVDHPLAKPVTIEEMRGKRIGIIRDIYYADSLRKLGIEPVEYATYRDLMAAVAFGWVDAVLAAEMTGNFFVRENGFTNVANVGVAPLTAVALEDFRLGVLTEDGDSDRKMLAGILDKAVNALSQETLDAITTRWLSYRTERSMSTGPLRLLPEEQAFIEEAPPLKIGFMSDYEPFSYLDNGQGKGFAEDITQYIASATGLVFEPVYDNWPNLLQRFRDGELDLVTNISYTPERAEYTLFSNLYHRIPTAVFMRSGAGPYRNLTDLQDRSIGIPRDIYYADTVRSRFTDVHEYDSQAALMQALADGEVDVALTALSNGNAIIRQLGLINIQIGGEFLMDGVEREDLRYGISPRYPYLLSIIDHALESIPLSRWEEMERRWLGPPIAGMERSHDLLDQDERRYLANKGPLRVCVDPEAPPYTTLDRTGSFDGAVAELLDLLAEHGDFRRQIETHPLDDDKGSDAMGCDVLPFVARENMQNSRFDLATPYLDVALAVASPLQAPFIDSMRDLAGQKVGVVPSHVPRELLANRYPDVELVEIDSERQGLRDVAAGRLDAILGPLDSIAYLIAGMDMNDVKISGRIPERIEITIATTPDEPQLGRIFDKLIVNLDPAAVESILGRQKLAPFKRTVDYRLLFAILAAGIVVLVLFLYWVRKLRSLNRALNNANSLLHQASITDTLTRLYNRGHFIAHAEMAFEECRRAEIRFTLAMIDVDHFKPINDRKGHIFGDQCLVHLAAILREHFQRQGDLVARYGGEEFIAQTTGGEPEGIHAFLDALRMKVSASPSTDDPTVERLTISVGFHSAIPRDEESLEDFIREADDRLYEAKRSGRDRVIGNGC